MHRYNSQKPSKTFFYGTIKKSEKTKNKKMDLGNLNFYIFFVFFIFNLFLIFNFNFYY